MLVNHKVSNRITNVPAFYFFSTVWSFEVSPSVMHELGIKWIYDFFS